MEKGEGLWVVGKEGRVKGGKGGRVKGKGWKGLRVLGKEGRIKGGGKRGKG